MHNLGTCWTHVSPVKFFAEVVQESKFHLKKHVYFYKLQAYILSVCKEETDLYSSKASIREEYTSFLCEL